VTCYLDSSAILAYLWAEPGTEAVDDALASGSACCTAANWAEVVGKVLARGASWKTAESALRGKGLQVVPIDAADAVEAGRLWPAHPSLSLGDRLCLAAATRQGATILTADRAWAAVSPSVRLIR